MSRRWSRTIYVGNLPGDIREREVEDLFYKVRFILIIQFLFLIYCLRKETNCAAVLGWARVPCAC
jgi:hypothetical protein